MKKLGYAAKDSIWRDEGARSFYIDTKDPKKMLSMGIFIASMYFARNVEKKVERSFGFLHEIQAQRVLDKYYEEYPELCLILCHLKIHGPLCLIEDPPFCNIDFKSKSLPIIRITPAVTTLGTNLMRFRTSNDVTSYYEDPRRIEETATLCEFWLGQFEGLLSAM